MTIKRRSTNRLLLILQRLLTDKTVHAAWVLRYLKFCVRIYPESINDAGLAYAQKNEVIDPKNIVLYDRDKLYAALCTTHKALFKQALALTLIDNIIL